jgi:hypothetical protein
MILLRRDVVSLDSPKATYQVFPCVRVEDTGSAGFWCGIFLAPLAKHFALRRVCLNEPRGEFNNRVGSLDL